MHEIVVKISRFFVASLLLMVYTCHLSSERRARAVVILRMTSEVVELVLQRKGGEDTSVACCPTGVLFLADVAQAPETLKRREVVYGALMYVVEWSPDLG